MKGKITSKTSQEVTTLGVDLHTQLQLILWHFHKGLAINGK